jgi:DNA-binding transcriptional LysR family regulator
MELRQIKYFVAVSDELSFTRAAQKLHVSQPPLSFQIASLETELGARLFDRTSRSVQLSEAGKAFLPHAQAVLARLDEAARHVQRVAAGLDGRVQVGLAGSHFFGPFPKFIAQFRSSRPAVQVVLQEMTPTEQLGALLDARLDVCVSRNAMDSDAHVSATLLWRDPVVVALPPGHALSGRKRLALGDLKDEDFVSLRLDSSPFAGNLFKACVAHGFTPKIVQQVVQLPAALNLVAAGLGVALVPSSLAQLRQGGIHICSLKPSPDGGKLNGDVYLLWRTSDVSPAVAEFKKQLTSWVSALPVPPTQ